MLRRFTLFIVGLAALSAAPLATAATAEEIVRDTSQAVLERLKGEGGAAIGRDSGKLFALIDSVVLPHFDFTRMSRWVLGRHWKDADEAMRERFTYEFRRLLVRTYGNALLDYADQTVSVAGTRPGDDERSVTVETAVSRRDGGEPLQINYRLHRGDDDAWKVYDVTVEGVSLVTTYRATFSEQVRRSGLATLVADLEQKNGGP